MTPALIALLLLCIVALCAVFLLIWQVICWAQDIWHALHPCDELLERANRDITNRPRVRPPYSPWSR